MTPCSRKPPDGSPGARCPASLLRPEKAAALPGQAEDTNWFLGREDAALHSCLLRGRRRGNAFVKLRPSGSGCVVRGQRISDGPVLGGKAWAFRGGPPRPAPSATRSEGPGSPRGQAPRYARKREGSPHIEKSQCAVPLVLTVKRNETGSAVLVVFRGVSGRSDRICWNLILS